jgi:hypothetical protein
MCRSCEIKAQQSQWRNLLPRQTYNQSPPTQGYSQVYSLPPPQPQQSSQEKQLEEVPAYVQGSNGKNVILIPVKNCHNGVCEIDANYQGYINQPQPLPQSPQPYWNNQWERPQWQSQSQWQWGGNRRQW